MAKSVFDEMLSTVGKVGIAHNMVKGMSKKSLIFNANVATYTTLVRGYCLNQDIDEALAVVQEMICKGLKQDKITYNALIKGLSEDVEIGGTIRFSYCSVIIRSLDRIGHCKEGMFKAEYELLVLMLRYFESGFEIYESLITGLLQRVNLFLPT
ncbi:hypothetical protein V6N13_022138 [Hibiscus sabdariffa]